MSRAAAKQPTSPARRTLLQKIHIAKKDLALADEAYRDLLERVTGKRSAGDCGERQLRQVMEALREAGWKPKRRRPKQGAKEQPPRAASPLAGKIRALWWSLYWLGAVRSSDESAIVAFARRQTGKKALQWLTAQEANAVIEALKEWCARAGFRVEATSADYGRFAKEHLCEVLWRKLAELGAVRVADPGALSWWLSNRYLTFKGGFAHISDEQLDDAVERLGRWHRKVIDEAER